MILAAARTLPKRIGYHALYKQSNAHGQWSIRVEPEGFQLDSYHDASRQPHAHSGKPGDDLVALPGLSFDRALAVVEMHLRQRGEIQFQRLLEELKP